MKFFFPRRRTPESVALEIIRGLEDGTVTFDDVASPKTTPLTPTLRTSRILEILVSSFLLMAAAPLLVFIWILIRISSSGPGLMRQVRVGQNGRLYRIYKFRTIRYTTTPFRESQWTTPNDWRVSNLGRFLRRTHLDELPQLINVLLGDMAFVGPRPERQEFFEPLAKAIYGYERRVDVPPGITGLAQIQLPPDTDLDSVRKKLIIDLFYINNQEFWLDIKIIVGTLVYIIGGSTRNIRSFVRLPNPLHMTVDSYFSRQTAADEDERDINLAKCMRNERPDLLAHLSWK